MRVCSFFIAWLIVLVACHAQNNVSLEYYKDSPMAQRWNSATKKAMAAMDVSKPGKPGKRKKVDPLLVAEFSDKSFTGGGGNFGKKLSGQKDFQYDEKVSTESFGTRSFFGIKNPWFGRKTVSTEKAGLWSKTDIANANKKFAVEDASTREFYQADKKAPERLEAVPTRSTKVDGKYQGFLDKTMNQKDLTIDQVRELLNKSR